ncbi:MAG: hypothetical protein IJX41_02375 [Bacteroidaceae bacterium]|nr:hypothetical protein [Bacteroidaceae bacterium]
MRITNKNGTVVTDIESWEDAFKEVDKAKLWKEGRSAKSLAQYFSLPNIDQSNGIKLIKEYVDICGFKNFEPIRARIEHESRFDELGKGRMHDMVIWGNGGGIHLVICIEAKVDEPFGSLVSKAYRKSVEYVNKNPRSKRSQRIKDLCEKYYKIDVNDITSDTDIRYQLLHYLAGSITEAKSCNDVVLMPIIVFKTKKYNKTNDNKVDFNAFVKLMNFELVNSEKEIYKNNIDGVDVYMTYIEIPI